MKKTKRLTAMILALMMMVPLITAATFSTYAAEVSILREDFESFADQIGEPIATDHELFGLTTPSTLTPRKDGDNTYLTMDIASAGDPNKTVYYTTTNGYQLVEEGTEGAIKTDEASYGLISGVDANLDKNIAVKHDEIDFATHSTVLFECKYLLSSDAKGTIYGQLRSYSSAETESGNWLALYRINATSQKLVLGNNSVSDVELKKNEWFTVSVLLDMTTGVASYYIDYALVAGDISLGKTELVVQQNAFIVGKIARTNDPASNASADLAGQFGIDDVRICTPSSDALVTVADEDSAGNNLMYIEFQKGDLTQEYIGTSRELLQTDGWTIKPVYFDAKSYKNVVSGKSQIEMRLAEGGGVRFITSLNGELYEELKRLEELGAFRSVKFGTLIAPARYVREAQGFTVAALDTLGHSINYIKVEGSDGEWYGEDYDFAGSIKDILPSHYDTDFTAIGYVTVTFKNGNVKYFYGDYAMRGGASVMDLAQSTLKADTESKLNTAEVALLKSYKYDVIDVGNISLIQNVMVVQNTLLFELYHKKDQKFDTWIALSYTGNDGWRIKATSAGGIGVESFGAAQALATYFGEDAPDEALPIDVSLSADKKELYVRSPDNSFVKIIKVQEFRMYFNIENGTENGQRVSSIRDIYLDEDNNIHMTGGLVQVDEGVYGGGERFDTTNKVNAGKMDLYTSDGWNNSSSTYMAIPLFVTTGGAGIFINRFERMSVTFEDGADRCWRVLLENDVMDCYIFACGDMKKVYAGYTALTGNASVPAEWSQGVMLCRYAKDLTTYEDDIVDENGDPIIFRDNAPSGRSVKTLVTNMIAAGMKPASVIMEAWNYGTVSTSQAAYEELKNTCDWLEEQGIKAMLYMRVAGSINFKGMAGFKEEYLLHAWVNGTYVNRIPDTKQSGSNPDVSSSSNYYLDITNPEAVEWFYDEIWGQLIEIGIDGVKIDFCETMPDEYYSYGGTIVDYDWYDSTKIVSGTEHHSYPVYFITTFYNRMNELKAATGDMSGFVVLSRGGGIGSQRNPYLWAGDQVRSFDKLDDALLAVLNSGLSGVPFMTYDMAGYRYDGGNMDNTSLELESAIFSRAVAFTAFTTNIQTHGTVRNAYEMTEQAQEIYRNFVALHGELSPYITKYVNIACETGVPVVRHLALHFQDDKNVRSINDQFLLGEGLLVAPIFTEETTREVYLPAGEWTNLLTGEVITGGKTVTVEANIGQIPVFLNNSSADAEELASIFAGDTWQAIMNFQA